jgi:hypothetical protein
MTNPDSIEAREALYTEFLHAEGYRPDLEKDGQVAFSKGDGKYGILISKDEELFRIVSGFWQFSGDAERAKARHAANRVMATTKVAKLYIRDDWVWIAVELFFPTPAAFKPVFNRCMQSMEHGISKFAELILA